MFQQPSKNALYLLVITLVLFPSIIASITIPRAATSSQTLPGSITSPSDASADSHLLGGQLTEYAVFPVKPNKSELIRQKIRFFVKRGSFYEIPTRNRPEFGGVLCWSLTADEDEAKQLKEALGSDASLILNASTADFDAELPHNLTLPNLTNNIVFQHGAPDDLKVLSWTKNTPHAPNFYAYDDDPIFEGQTIYLIDRGLDASSEDFPTGKVTDWLYSPKIKSQRNNTPTDDNDGPSHGSCVASKALGRINGVSKDAQLIMLKLAYPLVNSDIDWAFDAVFTDIETRPRPDVQPVVVAFAVSAGENPSAYPWPDVKRSMEKIFTQNAAIVVSAGNDGVELGRKDVDRMPAIWADVDPGFPLIVAGAVNNEGFESPFSQGPTHVTVWAPGINVECADRGGFRKASGTSFSTGMVAGLVAYGFARGRIFSGLDAKKWLIEEASWRRQGRESPLVLWNRV